MAGWKHPVLRWLARAVALASPIALLGCPVPPEGTSSEIKAFVRYEVVVAPGGFEVFEVQSLGTLCHSPEFEWVINKRVDGDGNPTMIDRVLSFSTGRPDDNGQCVLQIGPWGVVTPGEYRVVATDYDWIAKCDATLIALATSGSFHNVRFTKGSDGCEVTVEQMPP